MAVVLGSSGRYRQRRNCCVSHLSEAGMNQTGAAPGAVLDGNLTADGPSVQHRLPSAAQQADSWTPDT